MSRFFTVAVLFQSSLCSSMRTPLWPPVLPWTWALPTAPALLSQGTDAHRVRNFLLRLRSPFPEVSQDSWLRRATDLAVTLTMHRAKKISSKRFVYLSDYCPVEERPKLSKNKNAYALVWIAVRQNITAMWTKRTKSTVKKESETQLGTKILSDYKCKLLHLRLLLCQYSHWRLSLQSNQTQNLAVGPLAEHQRN